MKVTENQQVTKFVRNLLRVAQRCPDILNRTKGIKNVQKFAV